MLRMPRLKGMRFATAVIERYKRRETSVEEAMIETYLAGVSTRRIEDASEILWGASVSAGTVSSLDEKAFEAVGQWRSRPLARAYPCVFVDGICLKHRWEGGFENAAVMVTIGVNDDGCREVIGAAEGFTESKECWREFLSWLKSRGLHGVRMFTGDKAAAMLKAIHAQESFETSTAKAQSAADDPDALKLKEAAKRVRDGIAETFAYTSFPMKH